MERVTRTLLAAAARTASGTGDAFKGLGHWDRTTLVLDVASAATDAADTLNVWVQCSFDGSVWYDVAAFPTVLGNGGAKRYQMRLSAVGGTPVPDWFEMQDGQMAAGTLRPCFAPDRLRVKWAIVDGGTGGNVSFHFSVAGHTEHGG